jgi:Leishmanolysin
MTAKHEMIDEAMGVEEYHGRGGKEAVKSAKKAGATSQFTITIRFGDGLTPKQRTAFKQAANRWSRVIVGDLPPVNVGGELIDDVLILASGTAIDGPGKILGQAGPTHLRPKSAGAAAFLPARGTMEFDTADLAAMERDGTLGDVITHEMGHVLGIGTVWDKKGLLKGAGTANPTFVGKSAQDALGALNVKAGKPGGAKPVPVENSGGLGTRDSHWRESVFKKELMTGFVADAKNPLSVLTVASLQDLGYVVDMNAAEPYQLPDLMAMAINGELNTPTVSIDSMVLPVIPTVLPDSSMKKK